VRDVLNGLNRHFGKLYASEGQARFACFFCQDSRRV
jgi:hypothetical protein